MSMYNSSIKRKNEAAANNYMEQWRNSIDFMNSIENELKRRRGVVTEDVGDKYTPYERRLNENKEYD